MVGTKRSDVSSFQYTLLIIEDDIEKQQRLCRLLGDIGTIVSEIRIDTLTAIRQYKPYVVIFGDLESADLSQISDILAFSPKTKIVTLVSKKNTHTVKPAFELGVFDVVGRDLNDDLLLLVAYRAMHVAMLEHDLDRLRKNEHRENQFLGRSTQVLQLMRMVDRVAVTDVNTLILGETGTGKGLLARAMHDRSPRRDQPFIEINCASIPSHLIENELFGTESYSATEGRQFAKGKIEEANNGTLFLDEIGDMSLALQAKLLRFLQDRLIYHDDGKQAIPINVKIVSATYQDINQRVVEKRFREDLYYSISEVIIFIPPLRERLDDVLLLAKIYLHQYNQSMSRNLSGFTEDAIEALLAHSWLGNVRELQNKVKSAVIMADGNSIVAADLALAKEQKKDNGVILNLRQVREEAERQTVSRALLRAEGNMSQTANLLGISRPTLYTLIDKHSLQR